MSKTRILEMMGFKQGKQGVVYFDMDGVLADFEGGLPKDDSKLKSLGDEYDRLASQHPATKGKSRDEVKKFFKGLDLSSDPNLVAIKKALRKYDNAVFSFANRKGFFYGLKPLPGAKEMLQAAYDITGQRPKILTAPVLSNPNCEEEKLSWMEDNFPGMFSDFICTIHKGEHANGLNTVLIDDRTKYINKFTDGGGSGILHTDYKKTIKELKGWFDNLSTEGVNTVGLSANGGIVKLKVPKNSTVSKAMKASEVKGLTPLADDALHVTLLSGKSFSELKPYMKELDLSDISMVRPIYREDKLFISKRDELNKVSSFLELENQESFKNMVTQILNKMFALAESKGIELSYDNLTDYDKNRFFHVSIANTDGNPHSSIGDIKQSDRWYSIDLNKN